MKPTIIVDPFTPTEDAQYWLTSAIGDKGINVLFALWSAYPGFVTVDRLTLRLNANKDRRTLGPIFDKLAVLGLAEHRGNAPHDAWRITDSGFKKFARAIASNDDFHRWLLSHLDSSAPIGARLGRQLTLFEATPDIIDGENIAEISLQSLSSSSILDQIDLRSDLDQISSEEDEETPAEKSARIEHLKLVAQKYGLVGPKLDQLLVLADVSPFVTPNRLAAWAEWCTSEEYEFLRQNKRKKYRTSAIVYAATCLINSVAKHQEPPGLADSWIAEAKLRDVRQSQLSAKPEQGEEADEPAAAPVPTSEPAQSREVLPQRTVQPDIDVAPALLTADSPLESIWLKAVQQINATLLMSDRERLRHTHFERFDGTTMFVRVSYLPDFQWLHDGLRARLEETLRDLAEDDRLYLEFVCSNR